MGKNNNKSFNRYQNDNNININFNENGIYDLFI